MNGILLSVHNAGLTYQAENGEIVALKDVSFEIMQGEFVSIVGPSGCGKSTLLSVVAGLIPATRGEILLEGAPVSESPGSIGYMLQRDNLLEWRSIFSNALLGLEIRGALTRSSQEYAAGLMKSYGLWEFRDKRPAQLSGGMRQRVALIRTLAVRPRLLLLDEAFSALDYQTRLAVTQDVYSILKSEKITAIIVTHDIPEAISMADRVIVLSSRPATVKSIHTIGFGATRTPLGCRGEKKFSEYFNTVWKELDVHV